MHNGAAPATLRRSSRVPTAIQVLVTSMQGTHFSEVCETLVVNAHGCAILTRVKLDAGVPLHLHSKDGREATAQVVSCQPIGTDQRSWRLGAKLDRPENFWNLPDCPKDWALQTVYVAPQLTQSVKSTNAIAPRTAPAPARQIAGSFAAPGISEAQIEKLIADTVRPLQAEIRALKQKLAQREANPSRFEVSLSSIPPELEQQIEVRLRQDLGPRVAEEARQQAATLLANAKSALDQQTAESYETFLRGVAHELKAVEKSAQEISARISDETQKNLRGGIDDLQKKLVDGGNALKRLSGELFEFLQQSLHAEHESRREELEQLRTAVASEASRLREQVDYLDTRIAKLGESTSALESGLDIRLSRMSSETVKDTRVQFEKIADEIFTELTTRSVRSLSDQLDETSGKMKLAQDGAILSVSETMKIRAANAVQVFERSLDDLARSSVERCRLKLESGLQALSRSLNEQFLSNGSTGNEGE
ncbi:MAG TPA: hypothetical protein VKV39_20580 [Candidatus Sulfotelmatobacter sp.]|nr:hypothetical protein [Candidatus Sulfotelmatobacter sp.]